MHNPDNQLRRALTLPMLILYGLGTTIGGGIYALAGKVAARAGMLAPLSFVAAALLSAFTALAFAELSSRYPKSAGEAVYVQQAFNKKSLTLVIGMLVVLNGCISAAALANGFVGYLQVFVAIPDWVAIVVVTLLLGLLAIWGIGQSVITAAVITLVEIAGLILIVWVTRSDLASFPARLDEFNPGLNSTLWLGILSGSFLAYYAFIGFEDMVNVAEEVVDVERNLPRAIIVTLALTTLIYCLVSLTAVLTVPPDQLGKQSAPLTYIYAFKTGDSGTLISLISIFAIVNGGLIQMIMASRVLYGMSRQSLVPKALNFMADIHPLTQTPIKATLLVMVLVSVLALSYAIESLAQTTSLMILVIAVVVNTALIQIKLKAGQHPEPKGFQVPMVVPIVGLIISFCFAIMIALDLTK